METTLSINLISSNPKVRGGRPCIAGTGLRASDVVLAHLYHEQTADETPLVMEYRCQRCMPHCPITLNIRRKSMLICVNRFKRRAA